MSDTNAVTIPVPTADALPIEGVALEPLDNSACAACVNWLLTPGSTRPSGLPDGVYHAALQCSDSLVWGIGDDNGWQWASDAYREKSVRPIRSPRRENLLEARVFRDELEILLWRDEPFTPAQFRGRIARDSVSAGHKRLERFYQFHKADEYKRRELSPDFVEWSEGGGNTTVMPQGAGINVRAYLQPDADTGLLRVALTRFVSIQPNAPVPNAVKES